MKAWVYRRYGGPEVLQAVELPKPAPGAGEVLVRLAATSINAADYRQLRADPFLVRIDNGLNRPKKRTILGGDVAGIVEEVGSGVGSFAAGDAVFGETKLGGAFAEYTIVEEELLVPKPESLSFEEAGTVPLAGVTALQAVRDKAAVTPGDSVLIQGAGGGVGTMLVQVAGAYGGEVTAVCGPGSTDLVRSLGAKHTIDYTTDDFTQHDDRYDAIFGVNGYHTLGEYKRALDPGGTYVMVGGTNRQIFDALLWSRFLFMSSGKQAVVLTIDDSRRAGDLLELHELIDDGKLRPAIDRTFGFDELPEAFNYVEQGHVRGKVSIRVTD